MTIIKATLGPTGRGAYRTPTATEAVTYTGTVKPTGMLLSNGKRLYTADDWRKAYDTAHEQAGPNGTARVLMEPGLIEGFSASSGAAAAMADIGVSGRSSRILFYPKSGIGTVSLYGKSAKFVNFRGITIGGIQGGDDDDLGFLFVGGGDCGLWRSTVGFFNAYGKTNATTDDITFTEVVVPTARIYESDSAAFRSADATPGPITHGRVIGCWIAPTYRPTGTDSHTDTLQLSGSSDYDYFDVIDTVIVGSTNHGFIIGGAGHVTTSNVAILAGYAGKLLYPPTGVALPPSAYAGNPVGAVNDPIALNGGGRPGQFAMTNTDIIGRIKNAGAAMKGSTLVNVRCSDQDSVTALKNTYSITNVPYDASLATMTLAQLKTAYGTPPTKASLYTLWGSTYVPGDHEEPPVDNVDPTVSFVTDNTAPISGTAVIVVSASDTAPGTIAMNAFSTVADGKTVQLGSGAKGAGDQYVLTFPTTGIATSAPVAFPVTCTVTDSSGRTASATRTYTVDNTGTPPPTNQPPVVTFLLPSANAVLPRNGEVLLRARATDDRLLAVVGWETKNAAGTVTPVTPTGVLTTDSVFERSLDASLIPTDTTAMRAYATEAGDSPLTTRTGWVAMTVAPPVTETLPSAFTVDAVAYNANQIDITWTASTKGAQVIRYQALLDDLELGQRQTTRNLSALALQENSQHTVRVLAYAEDGTVRSSNEVTVTTPYAAPVAPVIDTPTVGYSTIDYSWAGTSGGAPATSWDVYFDNQTAGTVTTPEYHATDLVAGTTHTLYVIAHSATGGASPQSSTRTITTKADANPPAPTPSAPAAGTALQGTVQFRWTSDDFESGTKTSDVYHGDVFVSYGSRIGGSTWGADVPATSLPPGMTSYRIKSVDFGNNVGWSTPVAVTIAAVTTPDTTPPTGGITDPVDGSVVVPPFVVVRLTASDSGSGVSTVSLRTPSLGQVAGASLVSPGIWEAEVPAGALAYGSNELFARITDGAGNSFDTATVTLVREAPVVSPSGRGLITGPWLDGAFEPIKSGRITFRQRVPFPNDLGYITQAPVYVTVRDGLFFRDGVEGPVPFGFPPLDLGFEVDEEADGAPPRLGLVKTFPEGTVDGEEVPYGDLVPLEVEGMPANAYVPVGVTETLAAAAQVAEDRDFIEEQLGNGAFTLAYDPSIDAYRIIERTN